MNTVNTNVSVVARRRPLVWAAIVASIMASFVTGLLTANSFSITARGPKEAVAAKINPPVADSAPTTFPIVPSLAIEPHPQFFYGTGDGGNGYYSDQ
jgi:hypothetical protein